MEDIYSNSDVARYKSNMDDLIEVAKTLAIAFAKSRVTAEPDMEPEELAEVYEDAKHRIFGRLSEISVSI